MQPCIGSKTMLANKDLACGSRLSQECPSASMQSIAYACMHACGSNTGNVKCCKMLSKTPLSSVVRLVLFVMLKKVTGISCMRSLLAEQCSGKACCQALLLFTPLCWPCIQYIQQELQICSCCSFELLGHLSLQKAMRSRIQVRLCL